MDSSTFPLWTSTIAPALLLDHHMNVNCPRESANDHYWFGLLTIITPRGNFTLAASGMSESPTVAELVDKHW